MKRVCRVSPVPTTSRYIASACVEVLRCEELDDQKQQSREEAKNYRSRFRVPHAACLPAASTAVLLYISHNLLSESNLKNSGHGKVVI